MKIALYYPWIYLKSGIERTILELTKRSRHDWTVFTSHFDPEGTFSEFKGKKIVELKKIPVDRSYLGVLKAAVTIIFQKIDMGQYDALYVHSEGLGDFITFRNHAKPVICFCHTPLKIIHDPCIRSVYLKNNMLKAPVFTAFSLIFNFIDRLAWKNYYHVFCVSQEVKSRALKAQLAQSKDMEVIYRGVDTQAMQPTWKYENYFLHPTRIKWWKNVGLSIRAFEEFKKANPDFKEFKLIITGQVDKGSNAYYKYILDMRKGGLGIEIIPNISEENLTGLYKNCYAVLNTTLNEDWGLVPLEAMAYGKPVIAVNQGGPKESIVHNKNGFLVEPTAKGFAEVMALLAENKGLVLDIGKEARAHSLKYDWSNFVNYIDAYLESIKT